MFVLVDSDLGGVLLEELINICSVIRDWRQSWKWISDLIMCRNHTTSVLRVELCHRTGAKLHWFWNIFKLHITRVYSDIM